MTTRRKFLLALSAGVTTSVDSRALGAGVAEVLPLTLRLSASKSNERGKVLRLRDFHLVITNNSDERLVVWRDWCTWGWFCPTVSLQIGEARYDFEKVVKRWTVNYPDPYYIDPSEHYVLPVNLLSADWVQPKDFQPGRDKEAIVQATYTIKPDEDTKKLKVWTGTLKCQAKMFLDASKTPKQP